MPLHSGRWLGPGVRLRASEDPQKGWKRTTGALGIPVSWRQGSVGKVGLHTILEQGSVSGDRWEQWAEKWSCSLLLGLPESEEMLVCPGASGSCQPLAGLSQ